MKHHCRCGSVQTWLYPLCCGNVVYTHGYTISVVATQCIDMVTFSVVATQRIHMVSLFVVATQRIDMVTLWWQRSVQTWLPCGGNVAYRHGYPVVATQRIDMVSLSATFWELGPRQRFCTSPCFIAFTWATSISTMHGHQSSTLCRNWLCHRRGTPYLSTSICWNHTYQSDVVLLTSAHLSAGITPISLTLYSLLQHIYLLKSFYVV